LLNDRRIRIQEAEKHVDPDSDPDPQHCLLGKPILGAVSNEYSLVLATLVWWILFYSPGDVAYQGRILAVSSFLLPNLLFVFVYIYYKTFTPKEL
jgi:hypothetical protein